MTERTIYIYNNETGLSSATSFMAVELLRKYGFRIEDDPSSAGLIMCIGGDGTFLNCVHHCGLTDTPIIGVNTGHLGFFQEILPDQLEPFIRKYIDGDYTIQSVNAVDIRIESKEGEINLTGLNEMLIRGPYSHLTHFSIYMDDTKIQDFSGDGILFSTPAGSTAYNYSLGGSLVAPDLDVMQMTPVAPMNTSAYRCFRSSIIYPASRKVHMYSTGQTKKDTLLFSYDGFSREIEEVRFIEVSRSSSTINIIRLSTYDYWSKLTTKLL